MKKLQESLNNRYFAISNENRELSILVGTLKARDLQLSSCSEICSKP
jgi:hypothetical protein